MWRLAILLVALFGKALTHRHVTCYFRNWSQYGKHQAKFLPKDIDPNLCSVIKYAFLKINEVTMEMETTKPNDGEMISEIVALKKINPKLKVIVSVGGWGHEEKLARFSTISKTEDSRKKFIQSVLTFLDKYKLDGISFSWLYPGIRPYNATLNFDKDRFTLLLASTLEAFKKDAALKKKTERYHISATVSSAVNKIPTLYQIKELVKNLDTVDVIVHSLWGYWKGRTGSPTAMKGNQPTVMEAVEAWLKLGMPAEKLNVGFPLYGRTFKLESHAKNGLYQRTTGPGDAGRYTRRDGILAYYEICTYPWTQKTDWFRSETDAPYASVGTLWVGYDDAASLRYKVLHLMRQYNINGVTLWAMDLDDFTGSFCGKGKYPLLGAVHGAISEANVPPPPVTCEISVDIAFILDSSGSVRYDYQKEKEFIKAIATGFGISEEGSRAGVITFSYYAEISIKFKDHFNIITFNAAVDAIELMGYTTRIDRALKLAKNMFTKENGAREHTPKLLVLLTDGSQTQDPGHDNPGILADELRKQKVNILVVGIGSRTDSTELVHLAGRPENLFIAPSFEDLLQSNLVTDVKEQACEAWKKKQSIAA